MVKKKKLLNIEFSNQLICTWSKGPNKNWSNSISFIDETFCNFKWAEIWESTGPLERVQKELLLDKLGFIKDPIKSILIEGKQTRSIVTYLCHFRSTIVVDSGILILVLCIEVSNFFPFSIWAEWTNRSAFCEAVVHKSNTRK